MISKLKYAAVEFSKSRPWLWLITWNALPYFPFLLPHDKSYYGFTKLAKKEGGFFLDVGANLGMSAAGFHRLVSNYRILSVEADRRHEASLRRLKRTIPAFNYLIVAAGASFGKLQLHTPMFKGRAMNAFTSASVEYIDATMRHSQFSPSVRKEFTLDWQVVEMIPLDSLDLDPDIIKIDVEGYDWEVVKGLTQTIDRHRPVVMVEYNPGMEEICSFFNSRQYELFEFITEKDAFRRFDEKQSQKMWETSPMQVNLFAVPQGTIIPVTT